MFFKNNVLAHWTSEQRRVFTPYLLIVRPGICFGISILVILSTLVADPINFDFVKALLAGIGAALFSGAGAVINDFFDYEQDCLNHPWRVLPSGLLNKRKVIYYYLFLLILSLLLFMAVNLIVFLVIFLCGIVLFVYSWKIRKISGPISNVIIAVLIGIMCSSGGLIAGEMNERILILFVFGFLIALAREVVNDIEDLEGDRLGRARTFPMIIGVKKAFLFSAGTLLLLIACSYIPLMLRVFSKNYGFIITAVNLLSIYLVLEMLKERNIRFLQNTLKMAIFYYPGVIALSTLLFT